MNTDEIRFCGKWRVSYYDADLGEDYLPYHDTLTYVPAKYTTAKAYKKVTIGGYSFWSQVWPSSGWGVLGDDGCIPAAQAIGIVGGAEYKLTMNTWVSDGFNDIYVLPQLDPAASWPSSYVSYSTYYTAPTPTQCPFPAQCYWYIGMQVSSTARQVNAAAIAGLVISRQNETGYYNYSQWSGGLDTKIYMYSDYDGQPYDYMWHCKETKYMVGTNACVVNTDFKWKYLAAHVIGHRVAEAYTGPRPMSIDGTGNMWNEGEIDDDNLNCGCPCQETTGDHERSRWHCFPSRENIAIAQAEGYSDFFATLLFNDIDDAENVYKFVTWEDQRAWDEHGFPPVYPAPTAVNTPHGYTSVHDPQSSFPPLQHEWLYCAPIINDDGTEVDWLVFFSRLWVVIPAGGTAADRFSSEDIQNVWKEAVTLSPYKPYWDTVSGAAATLFGVGSVKFDQFIYQGADTRVNH